jgi:hypothetical protein
MVSLEQFGLIPVTTRSAYEGKHIYQILIERLVRLEQMLISRGFGGPIPRIQFHLRILENLQQTRHIGDDETLWSLVEATELADTYCTLPKLEWKLGSAQEFEKPRIGVDLSVLPFPRLVALEFRP